MMWSVSWWHTSPWCASVRYTVEEGTELVCRHDIDHVINDEHNRIITVVLTKYEIAPLWWFLREPKHVGAIMGILFWHSCDFIIVCISWNNKNCFDTVDARRKHEEYMLLILGFEWNEKIFY